MSTPLDDKTFALVRRRLLRLAGYADPGELYVSVDTNWQIHWEFNRILRVLEEIAARKVNGYGPFRYDEIENDWRWEIQSLYQDIERKFGRLKTLVRPKPVSQEHADDLLEILSDLAVYSARGIQIIIRLQEQLLKEKVKA